MLNDRTKLHFSFEYEWLSVDCEHSTIYTNVPVSIVPEQITAYVTANFSNNTIEEIEKKHFGWEIELNNGFEIKFDAQFNIITHDDDDDDDDDDNGSNVSHPEIDSFVGTYFPEVSIFSLEHDGNEYEVKLSDRTEIDFNLSFEWKNIDCGESTVYGMVPAELVPQAINDYVDANYPETHIDQIEKKGFGWEIELSNDQEIKFDTEFNVINGGGNGGGNGGNGGGNGGGNIADYPEITTFVETYFAQTGIHCVKRDGNEYEVKLTDHTEIDFNLSFEWKNIDCEHSQIYGSVPAELVPAAITDYVTANFANAHIDKIEKEPNGWEIELSNGLEIKFDSNFNVIEIDDKK